MNKDELSFDLMMNSMYKVSSEKEIKILNVLSDIVLAVSVILYSFNIYSVLASLLYIFSMNYLTVIYMKGALAYIGSEEKPDTVMWTFLLVSTSVLFTLVFLLCRFKIVCIIELIVFGQDFIKTICSMKKKKETKR